MIPFFVVDRPISLDIVKSYWSQKPELRYGIMTHALTTERFRSLFAAYPCGDSGVCRACHEEIIEPGSMCERGLRLCKNVVKMCDSGIFAGNQRLSYQELFSRYEAMNLDYGVMIDYLSDARRTVQSAQKAILAFEGRRYSFQLVLVAQGQTVDEYVDCYQQLKELGEYPIAVGGMLKRKINSARYLHVSQEQLLDALLGKIRETFDPKWLFVLGVYHPKRHDLLSKYGVIGADYKGWIFNYEHRRDLLSEALPSVSASGLALPGSRLNQLLRRRVALEKQLHRRTVALRGNLEKRLRSEARERRDRTLTLVDLVDWQILALTAAQYSMDGLSAEQRQQLHNAVKLFGTNEQEVRFAGVHSYFEREIVPKLAGEMIPGTSRSVGRDVCA